MNIFRSPQRQLWLSINTGLHLLETYRLPDFKAPLPATPIFIIGSPRSGSTLLYQIMVEAFNVSYLTNLHCYFFGAPSWVERWISFKRSSLSSTNFISHYGKTKGLLAPSECGEFWYQFFPRSPQFTKQIPPQKAQKLRGVIHKLGTIANRPLVFKNLINSVRLQPLSQTLPEALFIVIHRDPLAITKSLLRGRKDLFGNYNHWWSTQPPNIQELLSLPPEQQVVEQIIAIYQEIEHIREKVGPSRFLDIQYESLCQNVESSITSIERFLSMNGVQIQRNPFSNLPSSFPISTGGSLPPDITSKLMQYITKQKQLGRL